MSAVIHGGEQGEMKKKLIINWKNGSGWILALALVSRPGVRTRVFKDLLHLRLAHVSAKHLRLPLGWVINAGSNSSSGVVVVDL